MKNDFWEFADCAGMQSRLEQIGGLEFQSNSWKDATTSSVESLSPTDLVAPEKVRKTDLLLLCHGLNFTQTR